MGYRAEKNKIEKKIRIIRIIALCIAFLVVAGLCVFSAFVPPKTWKYYVAKPKLDERGDGELRIHFIDVGQGDATLIELPDGKVALLDGGDTYETTATAILRYLNALDIDVIDYLFVSHTDSDHCGSLATVLQHKTILNAYLPAANLKYVSTAYAEFYETMLEEECHYEYAMRGLTLKAETAAYTLSFVYPYSIEAEANMQSDGTDSSVLWLDYKGVNALFMADADMDVEEKLMRDDRLGALRDIDLTDTEILKVGHHGSKYSTSLPFLQYCGIEWGVISCGKNNPYGHPTQEVLSALSTAGVQYARTDLDGSVVFTIDANGKILRSFIE